MSRKKNSSAKSDAPTRRQVLKTIGTSALIQATERVTGRRALAAAPQVRRSDSNPDSDPTLQPFPLSDVRLLEGPFLDAQKRNEEYLLRLEADRMLHNFRVNAGLEPKAPVYGGWESVDTWASIRAHGHTLGHYLRAASLMCASTGHEELKKRIDYIVGELKQCQDAGKTGCINAFPENTTQIENMVNGRGVVGVPWYTLHRVYAGLRDSYLFAGNAEAREVLVTCADWTRDVTRNMTEDAFQQMLGVEHGGINEVIADVYAITGDESHLALAERFCHKALLDPLSEGRDTLNGLHSNTQIPKFVGFERLYQPTDTAKYQAAAEYFWKTVTETRSFATGGNGDSEHFFGPLNPNPSPGGIA